MMKEMNDKVSVDFTYIDEFGDVSTMSKTVDSDYMGETQLGVLNDLFHDFIVMCGFTYLADKRIEWVDDER